MEWMLGGSWERAESLITAPAAEGAVAILIPAYKPGPALVELIAKLAKARPAPIVLVDDGSGPHYRPYFEQCAEFPSVTILRHAVNLGKGAALKTGMNYLCCQSPAPIGVVTADADGQHHPQDIFAVLDELACQPGRLILGTRTFGTNVPWRSRFGNGLTRGIVRLLVGKRLRDTQTGLRGVPTKLFPLLLRIPANGYEFELDMLITAKHHDCGIVEIPIQTIYLHGNESSHFNPVLDSMRIYFVLLRFGFVSAITALIDNALFFTLFRMSGSVAASQGVGRLAGVLFNYSAARKAVFLSREKHTTVLPRYLVLVLINGILSYALIRLQADVFGFPVLSSKLAAESFLFLANFVIQRDLVFVKKAKEDTTVTDWCNYYESVPAPARVTRRYTAKVLCRVLQDCVERCGGTPNPSQIVELGGANSCFVDSIRKKFGAVRYTVIDNHEFGMSLLQKRNLPELDLRIQDVRKPLPAATADIAFSVGLIEHFSVEETRLVVQAHFDLVRPGGHVVVSFPTPTALYRVGRGVLESLGSWKFPDERPLLRSEVCDAIGNRGEVVYETVLWPLILTQRMMVIRKHKQDWTSSSTVDRQATLKDALIC